MLCGDGDNGDDGDDGDDGDGDDGDDDDGDDDQAGSWSTFWPQIGLRSASCSSCVVAA